MAYDRNAARQPKVKINYHGLGELLKSPMLGDALLLRAKLAEGKAIAIAPRVTDQYADSFYTRIKYPAGVHGDRLAAVLGNDDPNAFQIEVGTGDTPAHRTLRRAIGESADGGTRRRVRKRAD